MKKSFNSDWETSKLNGASANLMDFSQQRTLEKEIETRGEVVNVQHNSGKCLEYCSKNLGHWVKRNLKLLVLIRNKKQGKAIKQRKKIYSYIMMHLEVISPIVYIMMIKRYFRKLVMGKNLQWCMVWVKLNGHCPAAEGACLLFRSAIADFSHAFSRRSLTVSLLQERPKLAIYTLAPSPPVYFWDGYVLLPSL